MEKAAVFNRRSETIKTIEEWRQRGAPASPEHWKEGRSAYSLAAWWLKHDGERKITDLLSEEFTAPRISKAIAEEQTAFDEWRGGRRNHDLLLACSDEAGPLVVAVEAKADESFGETLGEYRDKTQRLLDAQERTNRPARIDGLTRSLAGRTLDEDGHLGPLRYQLLSATAGTIAAASANDAERAVLLILEFSTSLTTPERRALNRRDLDAFAERVLGIETRTGDRWLVSAGERSIGERTAEFWLAHLTVEW